jgi:hypothetical protein
MGVEVPDYFRDSRTWPAKEETLPTPPELTGIHPPQPEPQRTSPTAIAPAGAGRKVL